MSQTKTIVLAGPLTGCADLAVARLTALYAGLTAAHRSGEVTLSHDDAAILEAAGAELVHLAYQQKIYEDGREVRRALYARLLSA